MTTLKQIEANRRNALKSTGPATDAGKQRSRRNAVRHGLTAETVIATLEDQENYKAFELSVTADFDPRTAVERELILRLASLLWRLRRATAIETGLLQIQDEIIREIRDRQDKPALPLGAGRNTTTDWNGRITAIFHDVRGESVDRNGSKPERPECAAGVPGPSISEIARCFLRLSNRDGGAFERLNRYETTLWRQVGQILLSLDFLKRTG